MNGPEHPSGSASPPCAPAAAAGLAPDDSAAAASRRAQLAAVIDRLDPLPVTGGTVAAVRATAESPTATTSDLVSVIEGDEAFAANLLRYARSAALGRPVPARSVRDAVVYVGRLAVGRLALEAATYDFLQRFPGSGRLSRGQLHIHAVAVARCATSCAHATGADVETVYLAALLHDIGKLVLPLAVGDEAVDRIAHAHPAGALRTELERDAFAIDHATAGAMLAERSSVSDGIVEAIAYHHGGPADPCAPSVEAACVQLGNLIVTAAAGAEADDELLRGALARLGVPESRLAELAHGAVSHADAIGGPTAGERTIELERLANTDDLTGLANRRAFLAHVTGQLADAAPGCLLLIDIDEFKPLNDKLGHLAGDRALTEVAHLLARHGHAGRLGGDEFAIWSPGEPDVAIGLAELICDRARQLTSPGAESSLSVSIGIAPAPPHGATTSDLLAAADAALYRAKAAGRAQFAYAVPDGLAHDADSSTRAAG